MARAIQQGVGVGSSGVDGWSRGSETDFVSWSIVYDDVAKTLTIDVQGVVNGPRTPQLVVMLTSGQTRTFDMMPFLNVVPPTVITNVNLRVGQGKNSVGVLETSVGWV